MRGSWLLENFFEFTNFAAGAVLVAVPITILFFIFQDHLTEGLKAGANKG